LHLAGALTAWLLAACAPYNPQAGVPEAPTPRPEPIQQVVAEPPTMGAIFSTATHRPLFENRRARLVGDVITIKISEKTSASKTTKSSINRTGAMESNIASLPLLKESTLGKFGVRGNSSNQFDGKGETGSDNDFTGQITVTVQQVMRNGNLVVSGQKQVGLNGNVDVLKFSGLVNPSTILPDNTVLSSLVADARLDFNGRGQIKDAQVMGWLSRFFLSFLPI
jgi:flagellar L-ring protein precursor FlgH